MLSIRFVLLNLIEFLFILCNFGLIPSWVACFNGLLTKNDVWRFSIKFFMLWYCFFYLFGKMVDVGLGGDLFHI